jgi:hypothetical protein
VGSMALQAAALWAAVISFGDCVLHLCHTRGGSAHIKRALPEYCCRCKPCRLRCAVQTTGLLLLVDGVLCERLVCGDYVLRIKS